MAWSQAQGLQPRKYTCGYCANLVSSERGWQTNVNPVHYIYICPHCENPSFFSPVAQVPGVAPGVEVQHLPENVEKLYREARLAVSVGSCTASVLAARKLLMHIAVAQGAKEGESFLGYVDYLAQKGFVPPNGRGWVDHIRAKGNEANHEIKLMDAAEAGDLIAFAEMLLKFIYEFPSRVPKPQPKP